MKNNYLLIITIAFIFGLGGFYGGMKYQESQRSKLMQSRGMGTDKKQVPGSRSSLEGSQTIRGEIISQDKTTITVKLQDESTKIILLSENTEIGKTTKGTKADLNKGVSIMIFGKTNSDGSVSATNVQINPEMRNQQ